MKLIGRPSLSRDGNQIKRNRYEALFGVEVADGADYVRGASRWFERRFGYRVVRGAWAWYSSYYVLAPVAAGGEQWIGEVEGA